MNLNELDKLAGVICETNDAETRTNALWELSKMLPDVSKHLLAAEKLAEAVEGMEVSSQHESDWRSTEHGIKVSNLWREQRDAALASYREALK